ncbi:MAG: SpoIID/LytB domain-containing protein [Acidimicrobiia bacterium]|nr:SpoIID/LytB domain-containing protein [Acidimicrobiia bacterium]
MRRLGAALVLLLGATLLPSITSSPQAGAARADLVAIVVEGTGYGHGRGLSQWGAYGWAVDEHKTWQWILGHYYFGTTIGSAGTDRARVRLLAYDGLATVGLISHGPGVRWNGFSRASMYAREVSANRFEIYGSAGRNCPNSGSWSRLGTVNGPVAFTTTNGENSSVAGGVALGVCDAGGKVTHYRGRIEVRSESNGNRVVNDVKLEDYVRGVVPREVHAYWANHGGGWGAHAVRAQAVAARSFAVSQRNYGYAHLCDTAWCRVYGGAASRTSAGAAAKALEAAGSDAAVAATAGKVLRTADGRYVEAWFSASNGPRTAGGEFFAVDDARGDDTPNNPNHRWTRVLDVDTLGARYGIGRVVAAKMVEAADAKYRRFDGIWYNDVVLTGTAGTARVQAWDLRNTLGLPSPGFTIRTVSEETTIDDFGMIGDSVGHSIAGATTSEFRSLTDGKFRTRSIHVLESRCTTNTACPGKSGVEAVADLPRNLDLVVVELGYNDWPPNFANEIDAMMRALNARGARRVAWVNMADIRRSSTGGSFYGQANSALFAARGRWPTLTVLDWNRASNTSERSRWFADGVHLTATGQAKFAVWLRQQVDALVPGHQLRPPKRIELPVVGRSFVGPDGVSRTVPSNATAVALNVTSVAAAAGGYVTVWNCGTARPTTSNLNYPGGTNIANGVIAPIGANGKVCLYSFAATDLVVDVSGWFTTNGYVSVKPLRLVDTRNGTGGRRGVITPDKPMKIRVTGKRITRPNGAGAVVPADAEAVAVNVTAVDALAPGYLTVWPCGTTRPGTSNVNYTAGRHAVANGVMATVGAGGSICLYAFAATQVVVDVVGWAGASGATGGEPAFVGALPNRVLDTRVGTGGRWSPVNPWSPASVRVRGVELSVDGRKRTIPASASAVAVNVTIADPEAAGHATVWPCGVTRPLASNVNFQRHRNVANMVIAPVGPNGSICIHTSQVADVIVDVAGWFTGGSKPGFVAATPNRLIDTRRAVGPRPR